MTGLQRPVLLNIVSQHLEDAASLRALRSAVVRAPDATLHQLVRHDERLSAHLDGLTIAGDTGWQLSRAALEAPAVGPLFVSTVLAIQRRDGQQLSHLLSLIDVLPDAARAMTSAFGWVSAPLLRGLTAPLLASPQPLHRWLGVAACAQHRVDSGNALDAAIAQDHAGLRARALQAAAENGRIDLLPACTEQLNSKLVPVRLAAASAGVLLGDRGPALAALRDLALTPEALVNPALSLPLWLFSVDPDAARALIRQLSTQNTPLRTMIKAAGWSGDAQVVPWLLKQMETDAHARLAGEAFSFITGADLAWLKLERTSPPAASAGPNDDPEDTLVALDEDASLAWPDVAKLTAWWKANADQFPAGVKLLAGAPVSVDHGTTVLKKGTQRQRLAAALYTSLLQPGGRLFNCAAPARRQERLLAQGAA